METAKRRGNPNWGQVMPYDEARQLIKSKQFKTLAEYKEWVMIEKARRSISQSLSDLPLQRRLGFYCSFPW